MRTSSEMQGQKRGFLGVVKAGDDGGLIRVAGSVQ